MTDFDRLLRVLADSHTEFMLVGGVAAAAHGSARATYDIDTEVIEVFGVKCFCLSLERLIAVKRAAGRPKDLETSRSLKPLQKSESWSRRQLASASSFGLEEEHGEVLPVA